MVISVGSGFLSLVHRRSLSLHPFSGPVRSGFSCWFQSVFRRFSRRFRSVSLAGSIRLLAGLSLPSFSDVYAYLRDCT